ncbi:hypothetical protein [Chryseobacterium vrystaatense]|uniref:Uncharacterized protein n=1 Tax=Chryseobacterium vrystaatense TaxID=307480 RepID=A0ABR4UP47_9FLAO|nr:hypothetical protein [Chryseobacterium vrystaatense]KFF26892.1 hypothetical protein IW16_06340 [Chryseobacterium vrystaatense]
MKKYLVYIGSVYAAKNKLEKSIQDLLIPNDRMLLDKKDIRSFKENIIAQIIFINQENRRCNPKNVSWYEDGTNHRDFGLTGVDCISFYLYEIKTKYELDNGN